MFFEGQERRPRGLGAKTKKSEGALVLDDKRHMKLAVKTTSVATLSRAIVGSKEGAR
jgi:hypothetical protein